MKTVGEILKNARVLKGHSLDQVEHATKIRKKFLEAIEADDYTRLPSLSYAKGFVKNYSDFLGLDSRMVFAFFRRQTLEIPRSSLLPRGMAHPLNTSLFRLTPGRFIAIILFGFALLFLVYFGIQYQRLRLPPTLTIESPVSPTTTTEKRIDILGKTDPDATVVINGVSVLVRSDGKFFDQVLLEPGKNQITISAVSRYGKTTTVTREIKQGQER